MAQFVEGILNVLENKMIHERNDAQNHVNHPKSTDRERNGLTWAKINADRARDCKLKPTAVMKARCLLQFYEQAKKEERTFMNQNHHDAGLAQHYSMMAKNAFYEAYSKLEKYVTKIGKTNLSMALLWSNQGGLAGSNKSLKVVTGEENSKEFTSSLTTSVSASITAGWGTITGSIDTGLVSSISSSMSSMSYKYKEEIEYFDLSQPIYVYQPVGKINTEAGDFFSIRGGTQIRNSPLEDDDTVVNTPGNDSQSNGINKFVGKKIKIYSKADAGKALDIKGGHIIGGRGLQFYRWHGKKNQLWSVKEEKDDSFSIRSYYNQNLAIDVAGNNRNNGANLVIFNWHGDENQRWKVVSDDGADGFGLAPVHCPDKSIDHFRHNNAAALWSTHGGPNQIMKFQIV